MYHIYQTKHLAFIETNHNEYSMAAEDMDKVFAEDN